MPNRCRVSAVIVNYKAYEELAACLESLTPAHAKGFVEVIVVDNESTPGELARVAARFSWARMLPRPDNLGFGTAANAGAVLARGEYLAILNPDTVVENGAIELMAAHLDHHESVGVVGPRVFDLDGRLQHSARRFPSMLTGFGGRTSLLTRWLPGNPFSRHELVGDESVTQPIEVDWVAGSCMLVRVTSFHAVSGFDPRFFLYWEDADLCERIKAAGWSTVYLPAATVVHQVAGSTRHATARSIRAFHRSAFLYYRKRCLRVRRYVAVPVAWSLLQLRMYLKLARRRPRVLRSSGDAAQKQR